METPRFGLHEDAAFRAWLARTPRAIVLLRGDGCPYSATFEPVFLATAPPAGWALAIRMVEEGGRGPVAEKLDVEVTPSVAAFRDGAPAQRLPGKLFLGIPRTTWKRWLKTL